MLHPDELIGRVVDARTARYRVEDTLLEIGRRRVGFRRPDLSAFAGGRIDHDDLGLEVRATRGRTPVRDDLLRHAGRIIGILADRDPRDEILEPRHTGLFGDDRQGEGVPFEELGAALDRLAFLDVQLGTVGQLVRRAFLARLVDDRNRHVPADDDLLARGGLEEVGVAELDLAFLRRF